MSLTCDPRAPGDVPEEVTDFLPRGQDFEDAGVEKGARNDFLFASVLKTL